MVGCGVSIELRFPLGAFSTLRHKGLKWYSFRIDSPSITLPVGAGRFGRAASQLGGYQRGAERAGDSHDLRNHPHRQFTGHC